MSAILPSLRREIRASLEAKVDPAYLAKIRELVPSHSPILGVRVPDIRALVKPLHERHPELDVSAVCELVSELFEGWCREEMLLGVFLLVRFKRHFSKNVWSAIDGWIELIDNWEVCDQLAMNVAGEILALDLSLLDEVKRWTASPNPWRRRFALATTTVLNQKGRRFAAETLAVCEALLDEKDASVQKAVGWALREACKSDENAVFEFLRQRKARILPRILREASEKLSPAHRNELGLIREPPR